MNRKKVFALLGSISLGLILVVLPFITACGAPKPTGPIELKLVAFLPTHVFSVIGHKLLAEKINARSGGELTIKVLGGPEVMSGRDQPGAVVQGVIDIAYVPTSYYPDLVPGIDLISLSKHRTSADERKPGGLYDALQEMHNQAGLYFIGRESGLNKDFFFNIINKRVETVDDLQGTKIGATIPKWEKSWKELGVSFSVVPAAESYTAMERGVVDGFNYPLENHVSMGLHEVTDYVIDHGFFVDNVTGIMNLDTWNSLPSHLQDLIIEVQLEIEREVEATFETNLQNARQAMLDAGVEFIKFSPADAERYISAFYQNEMDEQLADFPEIAPKLAKLLGW